VYGTGCAGVITHAERLGDGRYNVVLRGIEKFTISHEETPAVGRLYRSAVVTPVHEALGPGDRDQLRQARLRLEQLLAPLLNGGLDQTLPPAMPDDDLVNALAQYLDFDPLEKLALLERDGALARCRSMMELLEMKQLGSRIRDQGSVH
jgi:uncharacterized protein